MVQELSAAAGHPVPVSFTPHLLPVDRGIETTLYFRPRHGFIGDEAWLERYRAFYQDAPFVEVTEAMPGLSEVAYTNYCRLTVREDRAAGVVKVFRRDRQTWSRSLRPGRTEHDLMFGFAEEAGLLRRV